MNEVIRSAVVRVGVDLAKRVIQVHAVDAQGRVVSSRALAREKFMVWCAQLPAGCLVAMETCSGAHHWARKLVALGLDARLIADHFVGPYRMAGRSGKNDATDAAAICEAASRPQMHFVPIKTVDQQSMLCVHRLREGYKEERTACINRIRGLLAEFGLVFPQSPAALREVIGTVLEDASNELGGIARMALHQAYLHWVELECHIASCDERIADHVRRDARARVAKQLSGIGPITASAIVASVGKASLGCITKRGDDYLRTLLIQGAKSAVMTAHQRSDGLSKWVAQLRERIGWQKAVVALANKNARILWAVLSKGTTVNPDHVPIKPSGLIGTAPASCPA